MRARIVTAVLLTALSACGPDGGTAASSSTDAPGGAPAGTFRDGLLYAAIKAKLAGADIDSASRISVSVHSGAVTLSGGTHDAGAVARDIEIVRGMRGVSSVNGVTRAGR